MKSLYNIGKTILIGLVLLNMLPPLVNGIKKNYLNIMMPHSKVAKITIDSVISDAQPFVKELRNYFEDPGIKAILLKIETPGSTPGTAQAIFYEIEMLKKKHPKPIITFTENMCASGGYYIACATDAIIATPSALLGSVGSTFTHLFKLKDFLNDHHIQAHVISAGKYKATTNMFAEMTPDQIEMLQSVADDTYQQFIIDVARARKLSVQKSSEWADGKIFSGRQAQKLGMIDSTGTHFDVEEKIKALAPIEGPIVWIEQTSAGSILDMFGIGKKKFVGSITNQVCTSLEQRYTTLQGS